MKTTLHNLLLCGCALALSSVSSGQALTYQFDDSGSTSANTGSTGYISEGPNESFGKLTIPIPADSFVDVDIPVSLDKEWSGIVIKKTTSDALLSPWIESVTVFLN